MSVKPTKFHKKRPKTLPEYEPITKEEEATVSEACCVCDGQGSGCHPENPSAFGELGTAAAAQLFAYWDAK